MHWLILLIMVYSCKGTETVSPVSPSSSDTGTNVDASLSERDESATTPTVITGTFLACDYVQNPVSTSNQVSVGCRIADQATGHKVDMSKYPSYDWGFNPLSNTVQVNMVKADSSNPWQVLYTLTGDYNDLQNIGAQFNVGLKNTATSVAYYEKVQDLVGRLNFLMEGTWKANKCVLSKGIYYMRTDIMTQGKYTTLMDYYVKANCTGTSDWTETIVGLISKVTFDGYYFYLDNRTDEYSTLPHTSNALPILNGYGCANISYQIGFSTNVMSCVDNVMEYTMMRFDEAHDWIYTALPSSSNDGNTAAKRKNNIVTDWYLVKQ